jgi:cytidine deaminase
VRLRLGCVAPRYRAVMVTNQELIEAALDCLHPYRRDDGTKFGNVSSAIASSTGRIYQGGNLFTPEGAAGICAEKIAFGAMATAGEYEPAKVVALWRPRTGNDIHIVPPCGWCRQFLAELQPEGVDTVVVLGMNEESPVSLLLPRNDWPGPIVTL